MTVNTKFLSLLGIINEVQNFERRGDPKKSMKIGHDRFEDMYDYLNYVIKGREEDPRDFWNSFLGIISGAMK